MRNGIAMEPMRGSTGRTVNRAARASAQGRRISAIGETTSPEGARARVQIGWIPDDKFRFSALPPVREVTPALRPLRPRKFALLNTRHPLTASCALRFWGLL